jgi:RNA polymerase sigma factor (sigma-70 family)
MGGLRESDAVDLPTDAAVIAASLDTPAAFGAIFDRHAAVLRRYLVRRLGPGDAEGILGDVFRIAFEKRATYDPDRPDARPWLYGIATRELAKHRRGEARRLQAVARLAARRDAGTDVADAVSRAVDASERWPEVAAAVAGLPDGERDALVLAVWEGLAYEDIAAALAIPVGTVRSRINRARSRLRREPGAATGGVPVTTTAGTRIGEDDGS